MKNYWLKTLSRVGVQRPRPQIVVEIASGKPLGLGAMLYVLLEGKLCKVQPYKQKCKETSFWYERRH